MKKSKKFFIGGYEYEDPILIEDIRLFADNDSTLYRRRREPIEKNLEIKYKKGKYNIDLATKLWLNYVNDAIKEYLRLFGSPGDKYFDFVSMKDRKQLAKEYAIDTKKTFDELDLYRS